jgi:hypothetical protein
VSDQLLAILKYVFLGVLYLFFLRVIRAVWAELRDPKTVLTPVADGRQVAMNAQNRQAGSGGRARGRKPRQLYLSVVEPASQKGQTFDLGEELTIGRAAGCGISLPDDTFVSQLHARVFARDDDFYLEDLGSTNGTTLNRKPVSGPLEIRKGDRLQVGKTVLEVVR